MNHVNDALLHVINWITVTHCDRPKEPKNAVRGHDKVTPYWVHPLLGAMLIMEDDNGELSDPSYRLELALAFLCHDILEDTQAVEQDLHEVLGQIDDLDVDSVVSMIKGCTIDGGSRVEHAYLFDGSRSTQIDPRVWYLKSVDKWINLMSPGYFIQKGNLGFYREFLGKLHREAVAHFPSSTVLANIQAFLSTEV